MVVIIWAPFMEHADIIVIMFRTILKSIHLLTKKYEIHLFIN